MRRSAAAVLQRKKNPSKGTGAQFASPGAQPDRQSHPTTKDVPESSLTLSESALWAWMRVDPLRVTQKEHSQERQRLTPNSTKTKAGQCARVIQNTATLRTPRASRLRRRSAAVI